MRPLKVVSEGERRWVQERVGEWEERLARMRSLSLRLEGEVGERHRRILKDLVVRAEDFKTRWEQIRSRLYVAEEEWGGILASLESLERAYEEVRDEIEPLFPPEASGGVAT